MPTLFGALEMQSSLQAKARLLAGSRWVNSGLVFTTSIGTPLDGPRVGRVFKEHLDRVGLRRIPFHAMRHSCATRLLEQGTHPRVVQEWMGHSSITLTLATYSHVMPSVLKAAGAALERAHGRHPAV